MTPKRTDWSTTSFSELSKLAHCEEQWWLRYAMREPDPSGPAAALGIALHAGQASLWRPSARPMDEQLIRASLAARVAIESDGVTLTEEQTETYSWLMNRYAEHYAEDFKRVQAVEETELELTADLDVLGEWFTIKAKIDQLLVVGGRYVVVERKTSGNKSALEIASIAPQQTLYWWLLQENGIDPAELWLDHTYTYRWKAARPTLKFLREQGYSAAEAKELRDTHPGIDRPTAESFTLLRSDRTEQQVELAKQWARDILMRRHQLAVNGQHFNPIRNLGSHCGRCAHKLSCWAGMSFQPEELFVVEEDGDE